MIWEASLLLRETKGVDNDNERMFRVLADWNYTQGNIKNQEAGSTWNTRRRYTSQGEGQELEKTWRSLGAIWL